MVLVALDLCLRLGGLGDIVVAIEVAQHREPLSLAEAGVSQDRNTAVAVVIAAPHGGRGGKACDGDVGRVLRALQRGREEGKDGVNGSGRPSRAGGTGSGDESSHGERCASRCRGMLMGGGAVAAAD